MERVSNPNLSQAQFKGLSRQAFEQAREHRLNGDLNASDGALRHGAVYRDRALNGVNLNGSPATTNYKTSWRFGDLPRERVLP